MTKPETAALNSTSAKSVTQKDGTGTECQNEMRIQPRFLRREQLFDRPCEDRQESQGNHQAVSPKHAPTNLGALGSTLEIFCEALGPHVLPFTSGISYTVNVRQRSALPSRRAWGQPFQKQLSQGAEVALACLNRLAGDPAGTEQRLQLAPNENPFGRETAMDRALLMKGLKHAGESYC